jgi:hypothetical protein
LYSIHPENPMIMGVSAKNAGSIAWDLFENASAGFGDNKNLSLQGTLNIQNVK